MINEGSHTYGRSPRLDSDGTFTQDDQGNWHEVSTEAQRALARQATVPTLGELVAQNAQNMVTTDAGTLMPAKLVARGESGWEFDANRDSEVAAKLAHLVKDMDETCQGILARKANRGNVELRMLARRWQAIRKITQGNQS